ncbi:hypothetical protein M413DRAFT_449226 [Hebeloma cylindrosporum]|uniref:Nephrocystin 3-like N-terminal domain-containing protein n=1 Tax=Hebeloma cylindrosporum TaxID=76867 RepID=A0A0C3BW81_HEBCY|nr:hypothetical protein M413DRAFT_449226 [Hebeloma cylindrosporum h7]
MFANSRNVAITGGSFHLNVRQSSLDLGAITTGAGEGSDTGAYPGLNILHRHVAAGALHDSANRSNPPKCHPDTRMAVLDDIIGWVRLEDRETDVIWLHGPAGVGKTAIAQTIAEMCQENGELAASFFFSREEIDLNNDRPLIPTLAYQISQSFEIFKPHLSAAVEQNPRLIFGKSLPVQMRQLLLQPLKQTMANRQVGDRDAPWPKLVIIDGLDECQSEVAQENILRAFYDAIKQESFPFLLLVASRPEPQIRDFFEGELIRYKCISLDDRDDADKDIATYLRSSFASILRKHRNNRSMPHTWPSETVIQTLVSKASGQFIYAATVVRFVDVRHQLPSHRLDIALGLRIPQSVVTPAPFAELDKLYLEIFSGLADPQFTLRVLGALLLLKSPLSIDALEELLGLQPGDAFLALCNLHSVLRVPSSTDASGEDRRIHLFHASLGEFLFDAQRSREYHIESNSVQSDLARCCAHNVMGIQVSTLPTRAYGNEFYPLTPKPIYVYARECLIEHIYSIRHFDNETLVFLCRIPPSLLHRWLRWDLEMKPKIRLIERFSALANRFRKSTHPLSQLIGRSFTQDIDSFFKQTWGSRFEIRPDLQTIALATLCITMCAQSPQTPGSIARLLNQDFVGFGTATLVFRPYISTIPVVKIQSEALVEYVKDPERCGGHNPNTPDIHADLVIYCLEFIKNYQCPQSPSQHRERQETQKASSHFDGDEEAYQYAFNHWRVHLEQASSRRLLNYVHFVNDTRCEVIGPHRCIDFESRVIDDVIVPQPTSVADSKLLPLLREIIDVKHLRTPLLSRAECEIEHWNTAASMQLPNAEEYDVHEAIRASRMGYRTIPSTAIQGQTVPIGMQFG